jgi:acyl-CoA synthetase (AMP-forming)/AMP-acid ligase II
VTTFWDLVDWAARTRPDDVVLSDDYGRVLTTATLSREAERTAAALVARGMTPGDVVSWQLPTTLETAVLMAACARIALVQNPLIPLLREREIGFIVEQVRPRLFISPETWRGFGHADMGRGLGLDVLSLDLATPPARELRIPAGDPSVLPPPPQSSADCRWIYYSSGTTSSPKGARHTDSSVMAASSATIENFGWTSTDVYPIAWPSAHIGGIAMLTCALRAGGTLVLFDEWDPAATPERMASHHPTLLGSATPFFNAYITAQRRHGEQVLFPAVRACIAGGAPTPQAVNREVADVLGVTGVASSWGLTEFPVATSECPDDPDVGSTVGRPVQGVEVRVVDEELWLRGPQRMLGYVDPSLDAAVLEEEGWFRTGDIGYVDDDGRVRIVGRLKDVIIRNAENVSALEVEEALLRHPAVVDAAVVGRPDAKTGERVCAFVVLAPEQTAKLNDITDHCKTLGLARYKWPEEIHTVDVIPRNSMGKVLKGALRDSVESRSNNP